MQTKISTYEDHLRDKARRAPDAGFRVELDESYLFPFQRATVEWALRKGRAAIFADTGLGKTVMQLTWAARVADATGLPVLILAPLAVAAQTVREAGKFGIHGAKVIRSAAEADGRICVCNYDRLKHLDGAEWGGVVLDESSILKSYIGKTKRALVSGFGDVPYRLACTATPAPNDHVELGNHAEFLGVLTEPVMKARWFINDLGNTVSPWRLKRHAVSDFWAWVASWARCIGVPSDVGDYSDDGYILPALNIIEERVKVDLTDGRGDGDLFRKVDLSATAIHKEKRRTAVDRAARVAALVLAEPDEPWLVWCETNYEQEALEAALPGFAVFVEGKQKAEEKARRLLAFSDEGGLLVTKPKIAGFGMNWQHCARVAFVGGSYSYEAFYQAVRRCWRFGQPRQVNCHVVMAETEAHIWHVVQGKAESHADMKSEMFAASRRAARRDELLTAYYPTHIAPVPAWMETR